MFLSPDGHAARFIISHEGDPATPEGISHVDPIKNTAKEAIKGTPLEGAKILLGGTAAVYKDMRDGSKFDLMIAGISAACLILIIMLIITRSLVAAITIVGTVLISLGASFGLSVLVWQDIIGFELHWMVLAMSVILLLAVGSDYNLLPVSRFKEEIHAGIKNRNHPLDGRNRRRGDIRRTGVRRHHGVVRGQRSEGHGAGRHDYRPGPLVRHVDRALVHDAVGRRADGALVLVAHAGADAPGHPAAGALRTASGGSRPATAEG
jgi:RND superfamily putative drug exporter